MEAKKVNLCIFAPSQKSYSETFIHAHKRLNNGESTFVFGALEKLTYDSTQRTTNFIQRYFWKTIGIILKKRRDYDIFKSIQKLVVSKEINVALLEYGTYGSYIAPYLQELGVPYIVHFHGYDASSYKVLEDFKISYQFMFQNSYKVIAVSKVMEKKLLEIGCPKHKLIYNVYGPNELFSRISPNYDSLQFLGIGRFVDKKAPMELIKAFSTVVERFSKAKLVMIGDGPLHKKCQDLIETLDLVDSVILTGRQTPEEIERYMANSMAFVQHSRTAKDGDMEGTPLSILESSSAGLAVVSTIHAGIPDVIVHGETGYLVEENDIEAMTFFMLKILESTNLAMTLGGNGRLRIKEHFTLSRHLGLLDELIISALN